MHLKTIRKITAIMGGVIVVAVAFISQTVAPTKADFTFNGNIYTHRRTYTITNGGGSQSNYDLLFEVDTATPVANGFMQSDCGDIRFSNSGGTELNYWIESGCNTTTTQIWAEIPTLNAGSNTVFMYYGNSTVANGTMTWSTSNTLVAPFTATCPAGWTANTTLNSSNRFPRGNATPGGTGGSTTHQHTFSAGTGGYFGGNNDTDNQGAQQSPISGHAHNISGSTSGTNLNFPAYRDVVYCSYNTNNAIPNTVTTDYLGFFDSTPSGWTRNTNFDGRFPRGNSTAGTNGGSDTHTHAISGTSSTATGQINGINTGPDGRMADHSHGYSLTSGSGNNVPPYYEMIFANPNATGVIPEGTVTMLTGTSLPPLGWSAYSNLNTGNRMPRGAASAGSTGGSDNSSHVHSYSGNTNSGGASISTVPNVAPAVQGGLFASHTHAIGSTNTAAPGSTVLPPYLDVYYAQRSTDSTTMSFTEEFTADVEDIINFQGKIINKASRTNLITGTPACIAAGADTCDFRARIYDASSGGTLLWEETHTDKEIGSYNGVFDLKLNSVCADWAGGCAGSGITWGDGRELWLQIEFDPSGNGDFTEGETFERKLLQSVPYSYFSNNTGSLNGISSDSFVKLAPGATQLNSQIGSSNLMAYYKLDETTGTRVDSAGTNDLTPISSPSYAVGKQGNAMDLSGSNYAYSGDTTTLSTGDVDFTVAGWVRFDALTGTHWIAGKWGTPGQSEYILYYENSANAFVFAVTNNGDPGTGGYFHNSTAGAATTGTWYFVVGWHDSVNNRIGISVNGTVNDAAYSAGGFDGTDALLVGNATDGRVDELGLWKRVLTAEERANLYNSGIGRTCTDPCNAAATNPLIWINENGTGTPNFVEIEQGGVDKFVINNNGYMSVGSGATPDAYIDIIASTTTKSHINLNAGVDVSSPNSGDLWFDGTQLNFYDGTTVHDLLNPGGTPSAWNLTSGVVHPDTSTNDLVIGGTSLLSSMFGIDESHATFYFGADNSANPTFNFEATDGDAGQFGFNTNDTFYFTNANVGIGLTNATQALDVSGNIVLTGNLLPSTAPSTTTVSQSAVDVDTASGTNTSVAIGADGLPVISHFGNTNGDLRITKCGNVTCTSGNTSTSIEVTLSGGGNTTVLVTSIAVPADGLPVVAYRHTTNQSLKVLKCGNAACSSGNTLTTIDDTGFGGGGGVGQFPWIAIGSDGLPIISYHDVTNVALKVAKCGNAACSSGNTITTVDNTISGGRYTSIAIAPDGLPVISYYLSTGIDLRVAKCGNIACSAGNTLTTVESTNNVGLYSTIVIGSDGLPIISHYDQTNTALRVLKCGNSACTAGNTATQIDNTATTTGEYSKIAIGSDGLPIISYLDNTGNINLKVAKCGNQACSSGNTITTVESTNDIGAYTSITMGADGLPFIAYRNTTTTSLRAFKCANHTCANSTAVGYPTGGSDIGSRSQHFKDVFASRYYGKSYNINNFDVAEEYEVEDTSIEAGDVVRFKKNGSQLIVEKTSNRYDKEVVGVISTEPGLYLKDWEQEKINGRPVALVGRVPVKVSNENGAIKRGDYLTSSSTPGVAMKATEGGYIVGRAMEDFSGAAVDSSLVQQELQEQETQVEEMIDQMTQSGEVTLTQASQMEEIVEEVTSSTEFGRIMMYVNLAYVGEEVYVEQDAIEEAFTLDNFKLTSGENLFKITEENGSSNLVMNIKNLVVAGGMEVNGDLKVGGKVVAKEIATGVLEIDGEIAVGYGVNKPAYEVTISEGQSELFVENSLIKDDSIVYLNANEFISARVAERTPGKGFKILLNGVSEKQIKLEYLIL